MLQTTMKIMVKLSNIKLSRKIRLKSNPSKQTFWNRFIHYRIRQMRSNVHGFVPARTAARTSLLPVRIPRAVAAKFFVHTPHRRLSFGSNPTMNWQIPFASLEVFSTCIISIFVINSCFNRLMQQASVKLFVNNFRCLQHEDWELVVRVVIIIMELLSKKILSIIS